MNFEQPFSPQEKQLISHCFDLSDLKTKEKNIIFHALFDYFETYPILKITLDDIIHHSDLPIKITSQKMDDDSVHAYQDGNNVVFNKKFFDKHLKENNTQRIAATLWHELVHIAQAGRLYTAFSQRGFLVYRQFIEAEAKSYTNLLYPQSSFDSALYKAIAQEEKKPLETQRKFIAISTRLRLNADRELAKTDAKNIMGKYFSEADWEISEKIFIKDWKDYYYKYHQSYAQKLPQVKAPSDNNYIELCEKYFKEKYGLKISAKSTISESVINDYNLNKDVVNTLLLKDYKKDVFDLKKWRSIPSASNAVNYVLDLPDMDISYINELIDYLALHHIKCKFGLIKHRDKFSSRCIQIINEGENINRFLQQCNDFKKSETIDESLCGYNQTICHQTVLIDKNNPPIFYMGENNSTFLNTKLLLTDGIKSFLERGGILIIGRKPNSNTVTIPPEIRGYQLSGFNLKTTDITVSRIHGYFFINQNNQLCYKDCSRNGTFIKKTSEKRAPRSYEYIQR